MVGALLRLSPLSPVKPYISCATFSLTSASRVRGVPRDIRGASHYFSSSSKPSSSTRQFYKHQRTQNRRTAGVVFIGIFAMMSVPLVIRQMQPQPMVAKDEALTGSQVQRGPFMNSGSKDAGRDPDWNLETRTWEGRRNDY